MSISSALVAAQGRVADAYTAISNKGGTLPATQNLANMPTAINSIPTGGSKYGCTIDNLLGSVDANGVLQMPANTSGDIVFTGVTDIGNSALYYKYYGNNNFTHGVSFPDLEIISGTNGAYYAFAATRFSSVSLPKLKTISGPNGLQLSFQSSLITTLSLPELETVSAQNGMRGLCNSCTLFNSVSLPKLKTVTGNHGLYQSFYNTKLTTLSLPELETANGSNALGQLCNICSLLETAYFTKLSDVSGVNTFNNSFSNCPKLTDIYFNALTTASFGNNVNQFQNMFNSTTGSTATGGCTVHFPSNMQSTIAGLQGYPTFGGNANYINLAFDLTATS